MALSLDLFVAPEFVYLAGQGFDALSLFGESGGGVVMGRLDAGDFGLVLLLDAGKGFLCGAHGLGFALTGVTFFG